MSCDNCGRIGETVRIVAINYNRGLKFWQKKWRVSAKFCKFSCLWKYCTDSKIMETLYDKE